jgi:hypothetical protein
VVQNDIKTIATYFELGMLLGIEEKRRISNWVDILIKEVPEIQDWMLSLSFISQLKPADIVSTLSEIEGNPNFDSVFRLISARLGTIKPIVSKKDVPLLRALNQLVHVEGFSSEDKGYIYQIDNDLDYALENIVDFNIVENSYLELVAIGKEKKEILTAYDKKVE